MKWTAVWIVLCTASLSGEAAIETQVYTLTGALTQYVRDCLSSFLGSASPASEIY